MGDCCPTYREMSWWHFLKSGKKLREFHYNNGKLHGLWTEWTKDGKKTLESPIQQQRICFMGRVVTTFDGIDSLRTNDRAAKSSSSRKDSKSTLAGLPARCVRFNGMVDGQSAQAVIWLARRGNTVYLLLALGKENLDMGDYKKYFPLID